MKLLSILLLIVLCLVISPVTVNAKLLPQAAKSIGKPVVKTINGTTIIVTPRLRVDRKAVTVYFANLQNASSVSYSLVYKHGPNGQQEGAGGALVLTGQSLDKAELLFGTCSAGVCRYHTNIKDARLEVSYTSKSGKKYLKKFRIKV